MSNQNLDLVSMVYSIDKQLAAAGQIPLLPQPLRALPTQRLIHFAIAGDSYALPIAQVIETGHLPDVTPLPNVNPSLRGVISFRGDVLPLFDLRRLLGHVDSFESPGEKMLIVRSANSHGSCALAVDRVVGLIALWPEEMTPTSNNFTSGFWDRQGSLIRLLNLERLFHHLSDPNQVEAN